MFFSPLTLQNNVHFGEKSNNISYSRESEPAGGGGGSVLRGRGRGQIKEIYK